MKELNFTFNNLPLKAIRTVGPQVVPIAQKIQALHKFEKMTSFSLAESCMLFFWDELGFLPISMKTKGLIVDIQNEDKKRSDSTDPMEIKVYNVLIELLDMLLMKSLEKDLQAILSQHVIMLS